MKGRHLLHNTQHSRVHCIILYEALDKVQGISDDRLVTFWIHSILQVGNCEMNTKESNSLTLVIQILWGCYTR